MSFNNRTGTTGSAMASGTSSAGQDVEADETFRLISSDKVNGTDVRRSDGERIGSIDHLMIDKKSGHVEYAVMTFGGFLGLGESRRAIPWEALHYNESLDGYELNIADDKLRDSPAFQDDDNFDWNDPDWNRRTRSHYGVSGGMLGS
jgi:PRC-barrel domain